MVQVERRKWGRGYRTVFLDDNGKMVGNKRYEWGDVKKFTELLKTNPSQALAKLPPKTRERLAEIIAEEKAKRRERIIIKKGKREGVISDTARGVYVEYIFKDYFTTTDPKRKHRKTKVSYQVTFKTFEKATFHKTNENELKDVFTDELREATQRFLSQELNLSRWEHNIDGSCSILDEDWVMSEPSDNITLERVEAEFKIKNKDYSWQYERFIEPILEDIIRRWN